MRKAAELEQILKWREEAELQEAADAKAESRTQGAGMPPEESVPPEPEPRDLVYDDYPNTF
jgi:hypothetical protein